MNLMTRDPFFGNLLDEIFENRQSSPMRTDIYEKNGNYVIEADIPGFKKENVQIDYDKGHLTITARQDDEKKEEEQNFIRRERYYGELTRSFYIGEVDENKIKAKFADGTLQLTFPKEDPKQTTKLIPIE